jgi:hypothetical protein
VTTASQPTNPENAGPEQPSSHSSATGPTIPGQPAMGRTPDATDDSPWHAAPADPWAQEAPIDPWAGTGLAVEEPVADTVDAQQQRAVGSAVPGTGRRRGLLIAGAAAAVLILAAAATTAVIWWRGQDDAVSFRQLSKPHVISTGDDNAGYAYARTATTDERTYLAWISGDNVKVTGGQLNSSAKALGSVTVGAADQVVALAAFDGGVVLVVDTYSPSGRAVYVLDPASLATRWHRTLGASERVAAYPKYVVLMDPDTDRVRRVDLAGGGSDKWNKQFEGATFQVEWAAADGDGPAYPEGTPLVSAEAERRVIVLKDGAMQVLSPADGTVAATINGIPSATESLAAAGHYYVVRYDTGGYSVQAFDLAGKQQPKTVYTADADTNLDSLTGCGGGLCVIQKASGAESVKLVALPTDDSTKPRWTFVAPDIAGVSALGDETLVVSDDKPHTWVLDKDGHVRYDRAARIGTRVTASSVLLWSGVGTSAESVGLEGYTVGEVSALPLGTADQVRAGLCSWTTKVLACPAGDDLAWWTFAD